MTFTESYIALCREHPLERDPEAGDWFWDARDGLILKAGYIPGRGQPLGEVWLPHLDQLRDLLDAAGAFWVRFETNDHEERPEHRFLAEAGLRIRSRHACQGSTPEEAAYRLLLAVREAAA